MKSPQCAKCADRKCYREGWTHDQLPEFCPMKHKQDVIDRAWEKYGDPGELRSYQNSTITEQRAYMQNRGRVIAVRRWILEIINLPEPMAR